MGNSTAHDDHVGRVEMEQIGKADAQPAGFPANQRKCRFVTAARSLDNVSTRDLDVVGQGSQRRAVAWLCQSRRMPAERRGPTPPPRSSPPPRNGIARSRGRAAAGAETPFAESGGVGIVLQPHRQVRPVLKKAREGDFAPAR